MGDTNKQAKALLPQYMHHFSCIGPACEDSCCVGWRVVIDEKTYKNYRKVTHPELKPLFEKQVTRIRSNASSENYAKIKMNPGSKCPFLTGEMWCKIQLELGADYLSHTCAFYPRTTNKINGVLESSATVSCPEVARKVLFNPDGIEFDEVLVPVASRLRINKDIDTHQLSMANKPQHYFWELRIFTIQVLQNRSYNLWQRLIILGLFYQKLQEYIDQEQIKETPQLIASFTNLIAEGGLEGSLTDIPSQTVIQMKLLKELADERFFQGINSQRYFECFANCLNGLQYSTTKTQEENNTYYQQAFINHYSPYMDEREYLLENYLVNYVFKNLFPLGTKKNVFEEYVILVIHYALIKMHLIGMAAFHKGLNDELVIKLVQSFAKTVEHNEGYLRKVRQLLKDNNINTMAFMAILIKN